MELALGVWERSRQGLEAGTLGITASEVCEHAIYSDASVFVRLEPAAPEDFEALADAPGIDGRRLWGIGDTAVLSHDGGGEEAGQSSLLVREQRDIGELHLRLTLGRPDLDAPGRGRELARLAMAVLPRFPGRPEPVQSKDTPAPLGSALVDPASRSLVGNLWAKEQSGEWSRGEGLVQTLRWLVGESNRSEVLGDWSLVDTHGTGIIELAFAYLEGSPDPQFTDEIERLLGLLVFTSEELDSMSTDGSADDGTSASLTVHSAVALARPALGLSGPPRGLQVAAREDVEVIESCARFFNGFGDYAFVGRCLEVHEVPRVGISSTIRIYAPTVDAEGDEWQEHHFEWAKHAAWRSAYVLGGLGNLQRRINVVFTVLRAGEDTNGQTFAHDDECHIALYPTLQEYTRRSFEFTVAHEFAHCFQARSFAPQYSARSPAAEWWVEGTADFFAHQVFPAHQAEWTHWLKTFSPPCPVRLRGVPVDPCWTGWKAFGPTYTLLDMSYETVLFWQYLEARIGVLGILDIIASLPTGEAIGTEHYAASLSAYPGMDELFHGFLEAMLDGGIVDSGTGWSGPPWMWKKLEDEPVVWLTSPREPAAERVLPFGVGVVFVGVGECDAAQVSLDVPGGRKSARPITLIGPLGPRGWGPPAPRLPEELGAERDRALVWSSTQDIESVLAVPLVETDPDRPECEEDEPPPGGTGVDCIDFCSPSDYFPPTMRTED